MKRAAIVLVLLLAGCAHRAPAHSQAYAIPPEPRISYCNVQAWCGAGDFGCMQLVATPHGDTWQPCTAARTRGAR